MEILELLKKENFVRYLGGFHLDYIVGHDNSLCLCPIAKYLQNNGVEQAGVHYVGSARNTCIVRAQKTLLDTDDVPEWVKVFVEKVDDEAAPDITAGIALEILKGI